MWIFNGDVSWMNPLAHIYISYFSIRLRNKEKNTWQISIHGKQAAIHSSRCTSQLITPLCENEILLLIIHYTAREQRTFIAPKNCNLIRIFRINRRGIFARELSRKKPRFCILPDGWRPALEDSRESDILRCTLKSLCAQRITRTAGQIWTQSLHIEPLDKQRGRSINAISFLFDSAAWVRKCANTQRQVEKKQTVPRRYFGHLTR